MIAACGGQEQQGPTLPPTEQNDGEQEQDEENEQGEDGGGEEGEGGD